MEGYSLGILSEKDAKEICNWKYEGEYSIYNLPDWDTVAKKGWGISVSEKRENEFIAFYLNDELVAYGRIHKDIKKVFVGIGIKPSWCGKGHGKVIMSMLVNECKTRYPNTPIALEVRSFNSRAVKCYENVGFKIKDKYEKYTINGVGEYYYMEY